MIRYSRDEYTQIFIGGKEGKKKAGHFHVPPCGVSGSYQGSYQTLLPQTLLPAIMRAMIIAMFVKYSISTPFLKTPKTFSVFIVLPHAYL